MVLRFVLSAAAFAMVCMLASNARAQSIGDADILILGDSQVAFGGGEAYLDFAQSLPETCSKLFPEKAALFQNFQNVPVGVLGVRAASINAWTARNGPEKEQLCTPEESWPVNARGFGVLKNEGDRFVQIGKDKSYPFCVADRSPLEAMLGQYQIKPKLLVLSLLGRRARAWAEEPDLAASDAATLASRLPKGTPCIYMSSSPTHVPKINVLRRKAQDRFLAALSDQDMSCLPVAGFTDQSVALMEREKTHFKVNEEGVVRDGFHPSDKGMRAFLKSIAPQFCKALAQTVLSPS